MASILPSEKENRRKFSLPLEEDIVDSPSPPPNPPPTSPIYGNKKAKEPKMPAVFAHRFRYFILILGCLCLTSVCSNMIALNFTLICMFHPAAESDPFVNLPLASENLTTTNEHGHPKYAYTQHEKSVLMWAVAIGSMAATFPLSVLYSKFGARYVFFTAGLVSAISTLLIPAGAEMGLSWFLALRVLQGIAYAADFAAIGVLCARWASLKQNGMFISILTCFSTISSSITNPVAGAPQF
uniref:Major facilitator superfamily (MFS) profile domain-containing protein n=1 Tax=Panagrolaimus davidi TaxID=227884 RepID=A0A914Q032_9BILA